MNLKVIIPVKDAKEAEEITNKLINTDFLPENTNIKLQNNETGKETVH